jgi:hypothetical protein
MASSVLFGTCVQAFWEKRWVFLRWKIFEFWDCGVTLSFFFFIIIVFYLKIYIKKIKFFLVYHINLKIFFKNINFKKNIMRRGKQPNDIFVIFIFQKFS